MGIIKTAPKLTGVVGGANAADGTYRQYTLTFVEEGSQTKVVATPRVAIGQRDVSNEAVWVLEGPAGERALWANVFKEMSGML